MMQSGDVLQRLAVALLVAFAMAGGPVSVVAQSALSQQFLSLPAAERERMMQEFGLSPDEVLGAIREGASSGGAVPPAAAPIATPGAPTPDGNVAVAPALGAGYLDPLGRFVPYQAVPAPEQLDLSLSGSIPYGLRKGLELFVYGLPSYQEVYSVPVPAEYVVGPGDVFVVSLFGKQSGSVRAPVSRDGVLEVPLLGPVELNGLTYASAKELITSRVDEELIGVSVSVSIDQLKSIQVAVSGEVQRPGVYVVPALVPVVQLLALTGGPTEIGSLRRVRIIRSGASEEIDLYDFVVDGDAPPLVTLRPGDAIHVPTVAAAAQVKGLVRRPGVYELLDGDSLEDLLRMAGGLLPNAAPARAAMRRFGPGGVPEIEDISLSSADIRTASVSDGTILAVPPASALARNSVVLRGAVVAEGPRAWRPGMMLSELVGEPMRDLRIESADLDYAYVVRTDPETRQLSFLSFSPSVVASGGFDLPMVREDVVLILSVPGLVAAGGQAAIDELLSDSAAGNLGGAPSVPGNPIVAGGASRELGASGGVLSQVLMGAGADAFDGAVSSPLLGAPDVLQGPRVDPRDVLAANVIQPVGAPLELESRAELLEPFMNRLRAQARDGSRVRQFTVLGEVHAPGIYPIVEGADLANALRAAGGLLESAARDRAIVLRKTDVSAPLQVLEVPISTIRNGGGGALQAGDVVTIGRDPSLANRLEIEIAGEVASPGVYTLPAGSTLSDLLEIAGGATERADLRSAVFSRARLREMEREVRDRYLTDIRKSIIDGEVAGDTRTADPAVLGMLEELAAALEQQADGRLQIDLPRLAGGDFTADLPLSTGDRLTIPSKTSAVSVAGQVRVAGSFAYVPGMDAESYLEMAGGISSYADKEAIFIVRADGAVELLEQRRSWLRFDRSGTQLLPGDRIVVPIDTEYVNSYDLAKDVIQFIYQTGIGLAAVVAAFN